MHTKRHLWCICLADNARGLNSLPIIKNERELKIIEFRIEREDRLTREKNKRTHKMKNCATHRYLRSHKSQPYNIFN